MGTKGRARFFFGPSMWLTRRRLTKLLRWHSMKAFTRMWSLYSRYRRKVCNTGSGEQGCPGSGAGQGRGGRYRGRLWGRGPRTLGVWCGSATREPAVLTFRLLPAMSPPRDYREGQAAGRKTGAELSLWVKTQWESTQNHLGITLFPTPHPARQDVPLALPTQDVPKGICICICFMPVHTSTHHCGLQQTALPASTGATCPQPLTADDAAKPRTPLPDRMLLPELKTPMRPLCGWNTPSSGLL